MHTLIRTAALGNFADVELHCKHTDIDRMLTAYVQTLNKLNLRFRLYDRGKGVVGYGTRGADDCTPMELKIDQRGDTHRLAFRDSKEARKVLKALKPYLKE
jgi:hypothetical protein